MQSLQHRHILLSHPVPKYGDGNTTNKKQMTTIQLLRTSCKVPLKPLPLVQRPPQRAPKPTQMPPKRATANRRIVCSRVTSPYPSFISQPMFLHASIDPRLSSTCLKPCRFKIEAAIIAHCPLPQKVTTGLSGSISSTRP